MVGYEYSGRNAESVSDSANSAAEATSGPVRRATAYQRDPPAT